MGRHIVIVRDGRDKVQVKLVVRTTRSWVYVVRLPDDPDKVVNPKGGTGFKRERLFEYDSDAHARLVVHEMAGLDPWALERKTLVPFRETGSQSSASPDGDKEAAAET